MKRNFYAIPPKDAKRMGMEEQVIELPVSDKPWNIRGENGRIILSNPDHPPMIVRAGYGKNIRIIKVEP